VESDFPNLSSGENLMGLPQLLGYWIILTILGSIIMLKEINKHSIMQTYQVQKD